MKIKNTQPKMDRSFLCCHALIWNILMASTITVCVFFWGLQNSSWSFCSPFLNLLMLLCFGHYCRRSHELWEGLVLLYFWPGWNEIFSESFLEEKAWGDVIFLNQVVSDAWKLTSGTGCSANKITGLHMLEYCTTCFAELYIAHATI